MRRKVAIASGKEEAKENSSEEKEEIQVFWLTYEYFISWVLQNEILELIFIDSVHPELIRRSFPIVSMLAKDEKIDKAYVEMIWDNARDTHEDTVRATLELIQKLAQYLNMGCLQLMFQKVNAIPNPDYDEIMIDFLRDYTLSAMTNYSTREREGSGNIFQDAMKWIKIKKKVDRLKYFNLDKFWDIANDDAVTNQDIKDKAINSLIEILGSEDCQISSKVEYLTRCINNLITGEKYIENWRLFKSIASKFCLSKVRDSEEFHKINNNFGGLVTLVIQNHQQVVKNKFKRNNAFLSELGDSKEESKQVSYKDIEEYKQLFTESLNLIKFIVEGSKIELSNKEIEMLIQIYVENYEYAEHGQDILY